MPSFLNSNEIKDFIILKNFLGVYFNSVEEYYDYIISVLQNQKIFSYETLMKMPVGKRTYLLKKNSETFEKDIVFQLFKQFMEFLAKKPSLF